MWPAYEAQVPLLQKHANILTGKRMCLRLYPVVCWSQRHYQNHQKSISKTGSRRETFQLSGKIFKVRKQPGTPGPPKFHKFQSPLAIAVAIHAWDCPRALPAERPSDLICSCLVLSIVAVNITTLRTCSAATLQEFRSHLRLRHYTSIHIS